MSRFPGRLVVGRRLAYQIFATSAGKLPPGAIHADIAAFEVEHRGRQRAHLLEQRAEGELLGQAR